MAHLEDHGFLKQLVCLHDFLHAVMRVQLGTWSVQSGAMCYFQPSSSSHSCDMGLQHQQRLRLKFKRNRESQHISLWLFSLSLSLSFCLLSVCASLRYMHIQIYLRPGAVWNSFENHRHPYSPTPILITSQRLTYACTLTCTHAHTQ